MSAARGSVGARTATCKHRLAAIECRHAIERTYDGHGAVQSPRRSGATTLSVTVAVEPSGPAASRRTASTASCLQSAIASPIASSSPSGVGGPARARIGPRPRRGRSMGDRQEQAARCDHGRRAPQHLRTRERDRGVEERGADEVEPTVGKGVHEVMPLEPRSIRDPGAGRVGPRVLERRGRDVRTGGVPRAAEIEGAARFSVPNEADEGSARPAARRGGPAPVVILPEGLARRAECVRHATSPIARRRLLSRPIQSASAAAPMAITKARKTAWRSIRAHLRHARLRLVSQRTVKPSDHAVNPPARGNQPEAI